MATIRFSRCYVGGVLVCGAIFQSYGFHQMRMDVYFTCRDDIGAYHFHDFVGRVWIRGWRFSTTINRMPNKSLQATAMGR